MHRKLGVGDFAQKWGERFCTENRGRRFCTKKRGQLFCERNLGVGEFGEKNEGSEILQQK